MEKKLKKFQMSKIEYDEKKRRRRQQQAIYIDDQFIFFLYFGNYFAKHFFVSILCVCVFT